MYKSFKVFLVTSVYDTPKSVQNLDQTSMNRNKTLHFSGRIFVTKYLVIVLVTMTKLSFPPYLVCFNQLTFQLAGLY
jgi:hypothetical protein